MQGRFVRKPDGSVNFQHEKCGLMCKLRKIKFYIIMTYHLIKENGLINFLKKVKNKFL